MSDDATDDGYPCEYCAGDWTPDHTWCCIACMNKVFMPVLVERDRLRVLLARFVDDEPCEYDHHGYCQTHALGERPCENEVARAVLSSVVPKEETPR